MHSPLLHSIKRRDNPLRAELMGGTLRRATNCKASLPLALCLLWVAGSAVAQLPAKPVSLSATVATAAVAYVAQTVTGASRQGAFSAGGILWQCAGNRCTATGPAFPPAVSACAELARVVGRMESYAYGANRLIEIAQCNAAAGLAGAGAPGASSAPGVIGAAVKAPPTTGMPQISGPQSTDKTVPGGSNAPVVAPVVSPQLKPSLTPAIKAGTAPPATPGSTPSSAPSRTAGGPIRTVTLQFQGSGASLAELYPAFAPLRITTVALQFRGSGASLADLYPAFPPVTVRTVPLQLRAAGTLP
jgi:hypothetical protein